MSRSAEDGWDRERGSALMLVPATVLILIVLAALAVDAAIVFSGERRIADAAAAAANDAAVAALSGAAFQRCGRLRIDPSAAAAVARESFTLSADGLEATPSVTVRPGPTGEAVEVGVSAQGTVETIFSPALPGGVSVRTVDATAVVTAEIDPALRGRPSPTCGQFERNTEEER
ncbi:MAG: hypothetical protein ACR2MA_04065 [Egibacteraceae bacterium]